MKSTEKELARSGWYYSIRNKWLEFQAMEQVEIIGITKTCVDTAGREFEGKYRLPGDSLFHQDQAGRAGVV